MALEAGQAAPEFDLPTAGGGRVCMADFKGKPLILYFYPKDDTPGSTKEAQGFAESYPEFQAAGIEVVGVSKDGTASHERFKAKYDLPFTLASDESGAAIEAYGAWVEKSMYGQEVHGYRPCDGSDRRRRQGAQGLAQGQSTRPRRRGARSRARLAMSP